MKPQVPVTRVHSRCGCIRPPASLWDHALLERGIPSGVLTCQRADHALIHTARCCQPSLVSFQGSRCSGEGRLHLEVTGQMKTSKGLLKAEEGVPHLKHRNHRWFPASLGAFSSKHSC